MADGGERGSLAFSSRRLPRSWLLLLLTVVATEAALGPEACLSWRLVSNSSGGLQQVCASCLGQAAPTPTAPAAAAPVQQAAPCVMQIHLPGAQLVPPFDRAKTQYVARIPHVLSSAWIFVQASAPPGECIIASTCWDNTASQSPPPIPAEEVGGGLRFSLPKPADTGTVCEVVCRRLGHAPEFFTFLLSSVEAIGPQSPWGREASASSSGTQDVDGAETDGDGMVLGSSGLIFMLLLCVCGACCLAARHLGADNPMKRGSKLLASIDGDAGAASSGVLGF